MIALRPIDPADTDALYPQLAGTGVTDTILWDGPASLEDYRARFAERAARVARGELAAHEPRMFTICADDAPIGCIDARPESDTRGSLGLWIGPAHQGRGHGTRAVNLLARYAFGLGLRKLEATVFVGNHASRRIFEKNGFALEGTIRRAACKRGRLLDEWLFGLLDEELRDL